MRRFKAAAIVLSLVMMASAGTSYAAGWEHDTSGDYWYRLDNGDYYRDTIQAIDGQIYAFDARGYMKKGWLNAGGGWYYFDPATGAAKTGWIEDGGNWYYIDPGTTILHTGWLQTDGTWYYMEPGSGAMHKGWMDLDGNRYYFNMAGKMQTGVFEPDPGHENRGYKFMAGSNGAILRNVSGTDPKDPSVQVRFDQEGKMMYSSDKTRELAGYNGGDDWQYSRQGEEGKVKEDIAEKKFYEDERLDKLAEEYYAIAEKYEDDEEKLKDKTKTWESKVRNRLEKDHGKRLVSKFIKEVENGEY